MRLACIALAAASTFLLCTPALAEGQSPDPKPASTAPTKRYLQGLTEREADALIAKLKDSQHRMKDGEDLFFELLSGAPASYDMTAVAPRTAFLTIDFDQTLNIELKDSGNPLWQPYRLSVVHTQLGQLYWDIEVVLASNGNIERVEMFYRPPAPF